MLFGVQALYRVAEGTGFHPTFGSVSMSSSFSDVSPNSMYSGAPVINMCQHRSIEHFPCHQTSISEYFFPFWIRIMIAGQTGDYISE